MASSIMKQGIESSLEHGKLLELSDRFNIQDTISRYAAGQDCHQKNDNNILQQWDDTFSADAVVDYSAAGGPIGSYRDLARWMRGDGTIPDSMSSFSNWQHMLSLPLITLSDDTATARTDFFSTHRGRAEQGWNVHFNAAGAFHDELVRMPNGWRIRSRRLELYFGDPLQVASQP